MSIANVVKSLNVPIIGKPTHRTEDEFLSNEFQMANGALGQTINMSERASNPQEILISCKGKRRRISGYLSEGVKLNGVSDWTSIVDTAGISALNSGVDTIQKLGQLGFAGNTEGGGHSAGSVIQQPWVDRKFWKQSKPFDLQFSFNLVAESSAKDDVFLPAQALLSFCYPRKVSNVSMVNKVKSTLGNLTSDMPNTQGSKNLLKSVNDAIKVYAIPGPSLMYGAEGNKQGENDNGDAVTIVIGNMFAFGACYLKTVQLEYSPNIDYSGFPVWCKCSISAEAMDSNFCEEDGSFNISQFANNANNISDLVQSSTVVVEDAARNVANIAKATVNAIGAFSQIFEK